jgi:type IV pilus assembly protein PilM
VKSWLTPPALFIEIGQTSFKLLHDQAGLEWPLEREQNGRLTPGCKQRLAAQLREFLQQFKWRPRPRAFCAIGMRGVSLRRLVIPSAPKENFQQLLLLQLEKELPLSPDEFAWGCAPVPQSIGAAQKSAPGQEFMAAAVKRELLEDYSEVLTQSGLNPLFTLGALATSALSPRNSEPDAILDIGLYHSELISFQNGTLDCVRLLPWGGEEITRSIQQQLGISRNEAEQLKTHLDAPSTSNLDRIQKLETALHQSLDSLAFHLKKNWNGCRLHLTGNSARIKHLGPALAQALGTGMQASRLEIPLGEGFSAATLGLKRIWETEKRPPQLLLELKKAINSSAPIPRFAPWKWAALALFLLFASFSLRYSEAFLKKPVLAQRIAEIKADQASLLIIDQELSFRQHLELNQSPYLAAFAVLASSTGPGTRIESLNMNRRGEISLRSTMPNAQAATDLRAKLIDSGWFSTVVVEEQTPSQDRRQMSVRIIARWKPDAPKKVEALKLPDPPPRPGPGSPVQGPSPGSPGPMPMPTPGQSPGPRSLPPGFQINQSSPPSPGATMRSGEKDVPRSIQAGPNQLLSS